MLVVGLIYYTNFTGSEMDEKYNVYYIGTAPPAHSAEYINARQTTTLYYIHFLRTVITCAYLNAYICSYSNASTIFGYVCVCVVFQTYTIYIYIICYTVEGRRYERGTTGSGSKEKRRPIRKRTLLIKSEYLASFPSLSLSLCSSS